MSQQPSHHVRTNSLVISSSSPAGPSSALGNTKGAAAATSGRSGSPQSSNHSHPFGNEDYANYQNSTANRRIDRSSSAAAGSKSPARNGNNNNGGGGGFSLSLPPATPLMREETAVGFGDSINHQHVPISGGHHDPRFSDSHINLEATLAFRSGGETSRGGPPAAVGLSIGSSSNSGAAGGATNLARLNTDTLLGGDPHYNHSNSNLVEGLSVLETARGGPSSSSGGLQIVTARGPRPIPQTARGGPSSSSSSSSSLSPARSQRGSGSGGGLAPDGSSPSTNYGRGGVAAPTDSPSTFKQRIGNMIPNVLRSPAGLTAAAGGSGSKSPARHKNRAASPAPTAAAGAVGTPSGKPLSLSEVDNIVDLFEASPQGLVTKTHATPVSPGVSRAPSPQPQQMGGSPAVAQVHGGSGAGVVQGVFSKVLGVVSPGLSPQKQQQQATKRSVIEEDFAPPPLDLDGGNNGSGGNPATTNGNRAASLTYSSSEADLTLDEMEQSSFSPSAPSSGNGLIRQNTQAFSPAMPSSLNTGGASSTAAVGTQSPPPLSAQQRGQSPGRGGALSSLFSLTSTPKPELKTGSGGVNAENGGGVSGSVPSPMEPLSSPAKHSSFASPDRGGSGGAAETMSTAVATDDVSFEVSAEETGSGNGNGTAAPLGGSGSQHSSNNAANGITSTAAQLIRARMGSSPQAGPMVMGGSGSGGHGNNGGGGGFSSLLFGGSRSAMTPQRQLSPALAPTPAPSPAPPLLEVGSSNNASGAGAVPANGGGAPTSQPDAAAAGAAASAADTAASQQPAAPATATTTTNAAAGRRLFDYAPLDAPHFTSLIAAPMAKGTSIAGVHEQQQQALREKEAIEQKEREEAERIAAEIAARDEAIKAQKQKEAKKVKLFALITATATNEPSIPLVESPLSPRGAGGNGVNFPEDDDGSAASSSPSPLSPSDETITRALMSPDVKTPKIPPQQQQHQPTTTVEVVTGKDGPKVVEEGAQTLNLPSDGSSNSASAMSGATEAAGSSAQKKSAEDGSAASGSHHHGSGDDHYVETSAEKINTAAGAAAEDPNNCVFVAAVAAAVTPSSSEIGSVESPNGNAVPVSASSATTATASAVSSNPVAAASTANAITATTTSGTQSVAAAAAGASESSSPQPIVTASSTTPSKDSNSNNNNTPATTTATVVTAAAAPPKKRRDDGSASFIPPGLRDYICGTISGVGKVIAGYPFDTLKGRVQGGNYGGSVKKAFFDTLRNEGPMAFYQGVMLPAVNVCFVGGILFYVNGAIRHYQQPEGIEVLSYAQMFIAGVGGGAAVGLWTVPVEVLKIRMQLLNKASAAQLERERLQAVACKRQQRAAMRATLEADLKKKAAVGAAKNGLDISNTAAAMTNGGAAGGGAHVICESNSGVKGTKKPVIPPFKTTAQLLMEEEARLAASQASGVKNLVSSLIQGSASAASTVSSVSVSAATENLTDTARPIINNARSIASTLRPIDFFAGFTPTMIRECGTFGLFFPLNEYFKRKIALRRDRIDLEKLQKRQADQKRARLYGTDRSEYRLGHNDIIVPQPCFTTRVMAAGLAGMFCWLPIYPADQIKTRMQLHPSLTYRSWLHCGAELVKKEGIKVGLFKGMGPCLVRAFPAYAAQFLLFEVLTESWKGSSSSNKHKY